MSRQIVLPSKRRVDIVSVVARFADMLHAVGDIVSAELREIVKSYTAPPEGIYSTGDIVSAVLKDVLIQYQNYPPEGITSNSDIVSAELT